MDGEFIIVVMPSHIPAASKTKVILSTTSLLVVALVPLQTATDTRGISWMGNAQLALLIPFLAATGRRESLWLRNLAVAAFLHGPTATDTMASGKTTIETDTVS